jgi:hypothetical protein
MPPINKTQATIDKNEILAAIDSRMSKFGEDHDTLTRIEELLKSKVVVDIEQIMDTLFGKDRNDGLVRTTQDIKGRINWFWLIGGAMFSALVYLVVMHLNP